jgi:hypothetical protein
METLRTGVTWVVTSIFGILATCLVLALTENFKELLKQWGATTFLIHLWDAIPKNCRDALRWERLRALWWLWSIFGLSGGVTLALWLTPQILSQAEQGANYLVVGPDPWEGSPLAIAWRGAQLREPVPNVPLAKYYRFIVNARNIGDAPIKLKDGYIVSSTDASHIPMLLSVPNEQPFSIDDANPVPPHAEMFLTANFPEGTSEPTLLREWGSFSAVIEYDNKQEKRQFER